MNDVKTIEIRPYSPVGTGAREGMSLASLRARRYQWRKDNMPRIIELREEGFSQAQIAMIVAAEGMQTVEGRIPDQPFISRQLSGHPSNTINGGS